jgi:hypothetical protein
MDSVSQRSMAEPTARVDDVDDRIPPIDRGWRDVHDPAEASGLPEIARERLLRAAKPVGRRHSAHVPAPRLLGTRVDERRVCLVDGAVYGLVRDDVLAHLRALSAATDLPVNADFESGFGADIGELSESVRLAVEAGVSGLSVEDRDLEGRPNELYSVGRASSASAPHAAPSIGLERT